MRTRDFSPDEMNKISDEAFNAVEVLMAFAVREFGGWALVAYAMGVGMLMCGVFEEIGRSGDTYAETLNGLLTVRELPWRIVKTN